MPKKKKEKLKLEKDQKAFIEKKVKKLGTVKKVEAFYRLDDTVSNYARELVKELKLPEK